jgi:primase-polymerase (primpol)-like protein
MVIANHHYAIDAAKLVEKCHNMCNSILDCLEENSSGSAAFRRRAYQLIELNDGEFSCRWI